MNKEEIKDKMENIEWNINYHKKKVAEYEYELEVWRTVK